MENRYTQIHKNIHKIEIDVYKDRQIHTYILKYITSQIHEHTTIILAIPFNNNNTPEASYIKPNGNTM